MVSMHNASLRFGRILTEHPIQRNDAGTEYRCKAKVDGFEISYIARALNDDGTKFVVVLHSDNVDPTQHTEPNLGSIRFFPYENYVVKRFELPSLPRSVVNQFHEDLDYFGELLNSLIPRSEGTNFLEIVNAKNPPRPSRWARFSLFKIMSPRASN